MGVKIKDGPTHCSPHRIPIGVSWQEVHEAMREERIRGPQEREGRTREERAGQKKTTIRFPVNLHNELKIKATKEGKTLSGLVIEKLREAITRESKPL